MTENSEQPPTENKEAAPAVAPLAPPVLLKGEIEIYTDKRLAHLDQGPVKAYAASGRGRDKAFALVCERPLVPQINAASKYVTIGDPSMPTLIGTGVVDWTPSAQQKYVFVYENTLGLPLATAANQMAMGFKADVVLNSVGRKLGRVLKTLRDVDFVHGNIRTANLYTGGGQSLEKVMLGECLSTPPGYLYNSIYEPVERAAAQPLGRGALSYADDVFAFGVLLTVMIRSADPMAGWTEDEILAHRMENGSYAALTGRERFTGAILELLRGILHDDPRQRWTIDEVMIWLDGQRVTHKQAGTQKPKAARPIDFFGEKYLRPQILSANLYKNPPEIVKLYDSGELKLWLNRSIQDKNLEEKVEHAVNAAKELGSSGDMYTERMAAFIAAALGPDLPMSYKKLKFHPEAFGRMLAEAYATGRDLSPYAEVLQNSLIGFWFTSTEIPGKDLGEIVNKFEMCRAYLRQTTLGYGLERCLYYLCLEAPCMSDKLKNYYIRTPEELILAYEAMTNAGDKPDNLFDRHVVAFLSIKDRAVIDSYIPDLNAPEKYRVILGTLRILSNIQKRSQMPPMPGLSKWLTDSMDPLVNRFHDRDHRARLKAQLAKLREKGDLSKIEHLFDNVQAVQQDFSAFKGAIHEYVRFKREYMTLETELDTNPKFGHGTGQNTAAVISGILSAVVILIYLFSQMSAGPGF